MANTASLLTLAFPTLFWRRLPGQDCFHVRVGSSNNVNTDEVAFNGLNGLGPGVCRCFDGGNIADNNRGDESVPDLSHGPDEFNVGCFEHRVCALDEGDQTAGFEHSDCLMGHIFSWLMVDS